MILVERSDRELFEIFSLWNKEYYKLIIDVIIPAKANDYSRTGKRKTICGAVPEIRRCWQGNFIASFNIKTSNDL